MDVSDINLPEIRFYVKSEYFFEGVERVVGDRKGLKIVIVINCVLTALVHWRDMSFALTVPILRVEIPFRCLLL